MGLDLLLAKPESPTQDERGHQGGDTGADMDHRPTREVEGAQGVEPAARAPDPVGDRVVNKGRPQQREEHEGLEALTFGERAADQGWGDDREHHLEEHEGLMGDGGRIVGVRRKADAVEPNPLQATDDVALVGPEREAIAP